MIAVGLISYEPLAFNATSLSISSAIWLMGNVVEVLSGNN